MEDLKIAPASDMNLLLNKAEITFHELHKSKLTTFDFFKQLTEMHEMLQHGDFCGTAAVNVGKYHKFMCSDDDDDVWVWESFSLSAVFVSLAEHVELVDLSKFLSRFLFIGFSVW